MEAPDDGARVAALHALGNSGSTRALPYLRGVTGSMNPSVSNAAIYALRFIPGAQADTLREGMLMAGGERSVAAVRAIAFRAPAVWQSRLEAAGFGEETRAAAEVSRVLRGWM